MAEPQAPNATEQARGRGAAGSGNAAEPRSFDEPQQRGRGGAVGQAAQTAVDSGREVAEQGRQFAEQSRRATRQMADAWRQAVDPFVSMQYDISQWFDDIFRQTFGFRTAPSANPLRPLTYLSPAAFLGLPPAELKETEQAHVLAIELPGLKPDDVDLSLVDGAIVVCGHKMEENEDASSSYRVSERRYGRFERVFPLPPDVQRERIDAQFRDGVLKITLPKTKEAQVQRSRIEVKAS
jgi:HSP20 family protein